MKKIYIDLETTGLNEKYNGVVQLSGEIHINGKLREEFNFLCAPFVTDNIDAKALEVTRRTVEEIQTFERPQLVYTKFTNMLGRYVNKFNRKDKFAFVGYNAEFDMRMLRGWFEKNNDKYLGSWFYFLPLCVMHYAAFHLQHKCSELPNYKLNTVCQSMGIEWNEDEAHDALYDIVKTRELLEALRALSAVQ